MVSLPQIPAATGLKRIAFAALAAVFFVLGILGALLPGIPATPFLLLCSYFLARSSPRLNAVLLRSKILGGILRDWQEHRGLRPHVKLHAIGLVTIAITATVLLTEFPPLQRNTILALAAVGIVVIWRLPTAE